MSTVCCVVNKQYNFIYVWIHVHFVRVCACVYILLWGFGGCRSVRRESCILTSHIHLLDQPPNWFGTLKDVVSLYGFQIWLTATVSEDTPPIWPNDPIHRCDDCTSHLCGFTNWAALHQDVLTCYGQKISNQIGCGVKFRVFVWNDFKVDQTKRRVSGSTCRNTDVMGVPYDYESIMHYGAYVRKFHWMAFPIPLLVHQVALQSDWSGVLRRLRFLRELNFWATQTGRPEQITCEATSTKSMCTPVLWSRWRSMEDLLGFFVQFRLRIMYKEGNCEVFMLGFFKSKSSNLESHIRKYKYLVKQVNRWNVVLYGCLNGVIWFFNFQTLYGF